MYSDSLRVDSFGSSMYIIVSVNNDSFISSFILYFYLSSLSFYFYSLITLARTSSKMLKGVVIAGILVSFPVTE